MARVVLKLKRLTSFQIIILGFAGVILAGALILMLPISSARGVWTPFNETLFTSTSAVCVTGLIVRDTGSYWSGFGQFVIITLIQIGGMGVITVAALFSMLASRRISLKQRATMQDAMGVNKIGGVVKMTGFIVKGIILIELTAALIMMPVFVSDYGLKGIWMAIFHSISAFCNAGFDILGTTDNLYPSLTAYVADPAISITIALLIAVGGIGFLTWEDVVTHKLNLKKYRMQSKVILVTTAILIAVPTVYFYIFDFGDRPFKERILAAFFQAVTPRTAGFNTVNLSEMTPASQSIMTVLMLIGGASGSTAGGMKVTTLAVLTANLYATFFRNDDPHFFGRRIPSETIKNAATIFLMYIALFYGGALIISTVEGLPMNVCLYESASAVGTVGLTLGITPGLGLISQLVLIMQMYIGRVGGLSLIYAAFAQGSKNLYRLPEEDIMIG